MAESWTGRYQGGAERNKEAQEMAKGRWPVGCPVQASPLSHSYSHSMPRGSFLLLRSSDRQERKRKRKQVERRGWRETGLGNPLAASPATPRAVV